MSELPSGWTSTQLSSVVKPRKQKAAPSSLGSIPFVGLEHVEAHSSRILSHGCTSKMKSAVAVFEAGDVLYGRLRPYLNKVARPEFPGAASAEFIVLPGNEQIDATFLHRLLMQPAFVEFASHINQGDRPRVDFDQIGEFPLGLPPISEQRRIVAKLDSLFKRSKSAREELGHIPRLVERYKQAILAAAFSGDLTATWRTKRGLQAPGEVSIDSLCSSITDGDHQAPPRAERGTPFITISAMNDGNIDLSKATRFVPAEYVKGLKSSRRPRPGDVLFSVTGSIGIPALVKGKEDFVFQRHIAILKPDVTKTSGRFLAFLLASPQIRQQALSVATGTAQLTIPLSGLREFRFPYPSQEEQCEIVKRLEGRFQWLGKVSSEVAQASALLDRLDLSTLDNAFRGKLLS